MRSLVARLARRPASVIIGRLADDPNTTRAAQAVERWSIQKMSAVEHWRNTVEGHHAQSIRAMGEAGPPTDFWRTSAPAFRADPKRTDDMVLNRLKGELSADQTLLDVGGGAGRFAVALALECRSVMVAEPSQSMLEQLDEVLKETGVANVTSARGTWEDVDVDPADVVLCSHVVYGVVDIVPFIQKLTSHSRDKVLVLSFVDSPQAHLAPLWRPVHGEERINLPALPEFVDVLWELGIYPDVEMIEEAGRHSFESREAALDQLRGRLWVAPDGDADRRLQKAIDEMLEDIGDGFAIRGADPRRQGLISWKPE